MDRLNVVVPVTLPARRDDEKPKTKWVKVGVAFPNKMGGFNINLDFPVGAERLVLLPPREDDKPRGGRGDDLDFPPG